MMHTPAHTMKHSINNYTQKEINTFTAHTMKHSINNYTQKEIKILSLHVASNNKIFLSSSEFNVKITEMYIKLTVLKRLCIPRRTLWRYTNVVLLLLLLKLFRCCWYSFEFNELY